MVDAGGGGVCNSNQCSALSHSVGVDEGEEVNIAPEKVMESALI